MRGEGKYERVIRGEERGGEGGGGDIRHSWRNSNSDPSPPNTSLLPPPPNSLCLVLALSLVNYL